MYISVILSISIVVVCGTPSWFQANLPPKRVDEQQLRNEFTFMVGLVLDGISCSGSLISDNYVLTAAHCLDKQKEVRAFFGVHSWNRYSHPRATLEQIISSDNFKMHPSFEYDDYINDIALIELNERIILTDRIHLINLPRHDLIAAMENELTSSTWGITDRTPVESPLLQFMFIELTQCPNFVPIQEVNGISSILCSIESPLEYKFHQDGGDPLILISDTNSSHTIVGVTSVGGTQYGDKAFTNVFYYSQWIHEVIGIVEERDDDNGEVDNVGNDADDKADNNNDADENNNDEDNHDSNNDDSNEDDDDDDDES